MFGRGKATNLFISIIGLAILAILILVLLAPTNSTINQFLNQNLPFLKNTFPTLY